MPLVIRKKCVSGKRLPTYCAHKGIPLKGNINPDNKNEITEIKSLIDKIQTIKSIDGIDGKDADEELIIEKVLAKLEKVKPTARFAAIKGNESITSNVMLP